MARRRYQSGYLFLRRNKWSVRYREDEIQPNGEIRRVQKCVLIGTKKEFPTQPLAAREMEKLVAHLNSYGYRPSRVATVGEFAERWQTEVLSKRKASTIHAAESHLRNQIIPNLGKMRLNELGVENQQMFVTRLSGTISRKMLLNVLGTLSSMLKTAQNWGYTCEGLNFRKLVLPEKAITEQAACFTAGQASKIISEASGQYRVMFAIAAMTGLRVGEILALQVGDFDLSRNLLTVRRSVWRKKLSTPKTTHSQTVLPVPDALARIVREHIATLKSGSECDWLFLSNRRTLFIAENVVRQALVPILDKLSIPRCGFHAFRHCHSTMLLDIANPKQHQEQMRHADPRVTIGVYSHVNAQARREVVEKLAAVLDLDGSDLCSRVLNSEPSTNIIQ